MSKIWQKPNQITLTKRENKMLDLIKDYWVTGEQWFLPAGNPKQ